MTEIAKNIYCFPVPLPGSPLKELNCYVVKGERRHLMIDVGFNTDSGFSAITAAFDELGLSLCDTDIFLTHLHADHTGLIERLKHICGRIYISQADSVHVNRNAEDEYWIECMRIQSHMGFPECETLDYKDHPAYSGGTLTHTDFDYVTEGMEFPVGGYRFSAIGLKGHTPGQMGLYDEASGVLFCGDHILNKITPNINLWDFETDYLGLFLMNLDKVKKMGVRTLLSAHRSHVNEPACRIGQLLEHHNRRLDNILSALSEGKSTVYEVANSIGWDYGGGCFANFPAAQKWFAASEVFAHLEHLRRTGKAACSIEGLTYRYLVK